MKTYRLTLVAFLGFVAGMDGATTNRASQRDIARNSSRHSAAAKRLLRHLVASGSKRSREPFVDFSRCSARETNLGICLYLFWTSGLRG